MKKYIAGVLVLATFIIGGQTAHASFLKDVWGGLKTVIKGNQQGLGASVRGAAVEPAINTTITPTIEGTISGASTKKGSTILIPADDTPIDIPVVKCAITSFTASPATITAGSTTTLSWTTKNCASVTLNGASVALNGSQATPALSATTTYTLIAKNSAGAAQSIKTTVIVNPAQTQSFVVLSPNGGEVFQTGQQMVVNWKALGYSANAKIKIDLAEANANGYSNTFLMSATNLVDDGTETLTIPSNVPTGTKYHIRLGLSDATIPNTEHAAISASAFTINNTTATVSSKVYLSRNPAMADKTISPNTTNVKIGSFIIQNAENTNVTINSLQFGIATNGTNLSNTTKPTPANFQNVKVFYNNKTAALAYTGGSSVTLNNINETLSSGMVIFFDLYADIGSEQIGVFNTTASATGLMAVSGNSIQLPLVSGQKNTIQGTTPTPSITINSPNGGEVYNVGDQMFIKWTTPISSTTQNVKMSIVYAPTGDATLFATGPSNAGGQGFGYTVQPYYSTSMPYISGKFYKLKAELINNNQNVIASDMSDDTFTINLPNTSSCTASTPAYIKVASPNGGEVYTEGQQITATWDKCNVVATNVGLVVSQFNPNGTIVDYVLKAQTLNDGVESIILPTFIKNSSLSPGKYYKLLVSNDQTNGDLSDDTFTINKKPVIIKNPEPTLPITSGPTVLVPALSKTKVKDIQNTLKAQGFFTVSPNGNFGPKTKDAVKKFQEANGFDATGVVDTATSEALKRGSVRLGDETITIPPDTTLGQLFKRCSITSLSAAPAVINSGATSTIAWKTSGCQGATLDGARVAVLSGTRATGALTATKTYTLVAGGNKNTDTKSVTIVVNQPFAVTSPNGGEVLTGGQPIVVTWNQGALPANSIVSINLKGSAMGGLLLQSPTNTLRFPITNKQATIQLPTVASLKVRFPGVVAGKYFKVEIVGMSPTYTVLGIDESDNLFTIN